MEVESCAAISQFISSLAVIVVQIISSSHMTCSSNVSGSHSNHLKGREQKTLPVSGNGTLWETSTELSRVLILYFHYVMGIVKCAYSRLKGAAPVSQLVFRRN